MTPQLLARYAIALPRDYDMAIIRERVRTRGSALDDRAGLMVKAYCIRTAGTDGADVNEYAPFYVWGDADAAAQFLWRGTGFQGIVADFGRPRVSTWVPEAVVSGMVAAADVRHAWVDEQPVPPGADLVRFADQLRDETARLAEQEGVHRAVAGVDPSRWTVVRFVTSAHPVDVPGVAYEVLHVSQPTDEVGGPASTTGRRQSDAGDQMSENLVAPVSSGSRSPRTR